jgi:hypothetical protein
VTHFCATIDTFGRPKHKHVATPNATIDPFNVLVYTEKTWSTDQNINIDVALCNSNFA